MRKPSPEIRSQYKPSEFEKNGIRKIKLYVVLRYSLEGVRTEKSTGLYYIVPAAAYEHRGKGELEAQLPSIFKKCTFSDKLHNKKVKSDLALKKSELLLELQFDGMPFSTNRDKQFEASKTEFLSLYSKFVQYTEDLGRDEGTVRNYQQSRDKFERFRPKGTLGSIDATTVIKFQTWMVNEDGLSLNTVARHITALSNCMNWLVLNDYLEKSPFRKMRRGDRIFQNDNADSNPTVRSKSFFALVELKDIWEKRNHRVRREELDTTLAWLFSNMVGLRFCDMVTLVPEQIYSITKDGIEYFYIDKFQGKTTKKVYVPLNNSALEILREVQKQNPTYRSRCFRIRQNREMSSIRGTVKKVRYGNSRHSFGNNLKRAGVQEADVSCLSGRISKSISETNYSDHFKNNIDYYHELVSRINFL